MAPVEPEYSVLPAWDSDTSVDLNEKSTSTPTSTSKATRRKRYITIGGVMVIVGTLIASAAGVYRSQSTPKVWMHCGGTPELARERGCHFEPMMLTWIPDACWFPEPVDEYREYMDSRKWFIDPLMRHPAPPGLAEAGDYDVLYSKAFHKVHCLYAWRKQSWSAKKRMAWVDSTTADIKHADHCAMGLEPVIKAVEARVSEETMDHLLNTTAGVVEYPTCIRSPWHTWPDKLVEGVIFSERPLGLGRESSGR